MAKRKSARARAIQASERRVFVDANPTGAGFVIVPDMVFGHVPLRLDNSVKQEVNALLTAVLLLQYEQSVRTVFFTDCDSVVRGVVGRSKLHRTSRPDPQLDATLMLLRKYFENTPWSLYHITRGQNKVAHFMAARPGGYYALHTPTTLIDFEIMNGQRFRPISQWSEVNRIKKSIIETEQLLAA